MHSKILASIGVIGTMLSVSAFAEAPVQPGETLESLSKVKVMTTVNGQPGSIQELVNSGQIKLIAPDTAPTQATAAMDPAGQVVSTPTEQHPLAPNAELSAQQAEAALNEAVPPATNPEMSAAPAAAPQLDSSAEVPANAMEPDSLPSPDAPAQALPDASMEQPVQAAPDAPAHDSIN